MKSVYMDYAATTPVDRRVVDAMEPYWSQIFGNSSSAHSFGQAARDAVERARDQIAALLGADRWEIIFTSGGSESDNAAIQMLRSQRSGGRHLICSAIEHDAVLKTMSQMESLGFDLSIIPVDAAGLVDPDAIRSAIRPDTALISVHHANNEIGVLQPIAEIGQIAREHGVLFHTDAVQTYGHIPIDVNLLNVDMLALSAHKFYGPKGVGALYVKKDTPFYPLIFGGGQEDKRRASTHNVAGIVGMGIAAEIAAAEMDEEGRRILRFRKLLWQKLRSELDGLTLNGHESQRLENNLNFTIYGVESASLLISLDLEGIAASSGSACTSGSGVSSHVLAALGDQGVHSHGNLRITLGRFTTEDDIDRTVNAICISVRRLRSLSGL
ncbi:cysteine desulfurase [bacterium]|nr:cysteine desulfurase [bacterium]